MTDFAALAAPFPAEAVSWRIGTSNKKKRQKETGDNFAKATKGIALAYIDARDVMDRLDAVCGPGGWQCQYPHANGKTVCAIGIKVGDDWVWKADGAGDSDIEAEKGALSDAFKRAAVRWGIGRYLYHIASPWVDLDDREQISQADRRKLEALLTNTAPKADLTPSAAVSAASVAIGLCATEAELTQWSADNKGVLASLDDGDKRAIRRAYSERQNAIRSTPFDEKKAA